MCDVIPEVMLCGHQRMSDKNIPLVVVSHVKLDITMETSKDIVMETSTQTNRTHYTFN